MSAGSQVELMGMKQTDRPPCLILPLEGRPDYFNFFSAQCSRELSLRSREINQRRPKDDL